MRVLSLLDFVAAIHEMSSMINIDQMIGESFELMGGSDSEGLSVI